jgi:hypothetical protein
MKHATTFEMISVARPEFRGGWLEITSSHVASGNHDEHQHDGEQHDGIRFIVEQDILVKGRTQRDTKLPSYSCPCPGFAS